RAVLRRPGRPRPDPGRPSRRRGGDRAAGRPDRQPARGPAQPRRRGRGSATGGGRGRPARGAGIGFGTRRPTGPPARGPGARGRVSLFLRGRLAAFVRVWLGISLLAFGLGNLAPGDPAYLMLQRQSDRAPTAEALAALRQQLGLDDPLPVRYARWALAAIH